MGIQWSSLFCTICRWNMILSFSKHFLTVCGLGTVGVNTISKQCFMYIQSSAKGLYLLQTKCDLFWYRHMDSSPWVIFYTFFHLHKSICSQYEMYSWCKLCWPCTCAIYKIPFFLGRSSAYIMNIIYLGLQPNWNCYLQTSSASSRSDKILCFFPLHAHTHARTHAPTHARAHTHTDLFCSSVRVGTFHGPYFHWHNFQWLLCYHFFDNFL